MILLSFENGDCLRRQGQSVIAEFTGRRRCLSTSPLNGGIAEHLTAVFNHDCLPPDGSWFVMKEATYEEHLRATASSLGLNPDTVSGMITTAQMDSLAIAREEWRGTAVTAAVTAGIDKNGGRAGDRADWHEGEDCPLGGTVNIMLFFSADLPPGTLARALVTCTEAKTAALQELLAPSCYSDGLATGSGTDSAILVSDAESPLRLTYAGKHCKLGEMIGCAVIRAVKESLFLQTGLNAERQLNLYARLGRFGVTRELLWRDGEISAECPAPLVPRPVPPVWKSQFDPALQSAQEGEVFISDVCRGLKAVAPGALKDVRVVQIFPRTAPDQYLPNVGCGGHENARGVLGTAKVEADGSARFIVPAKTPILFQVLDAEGRAWRTMRSTTSLMPGERVSCVGCHEPKREASAHAAVVSDAMKKPAQRLVVPPGGGRPWGFVENIQPIFDRKGISCHAGDKAPKGIDLTRAVDPRFSVDVKVKQVGYRQYSAPFTKSYATLVFTDEELPKHTHDKTKKFQWYAPRMGKDAAGQPLRMVPNWPEYNHVQTTPEGTAGRSSITSGLMAKLSRGKHGKMLTPE